MKVCITGAGGQLGVALKQTQPQDVEILAAPRPVIDVTDATSVSLFLAQHRPQVIINAAAFTAVDRAESEPERAARANVDGVRNLAIAANVIGARLLQVSTNYVFDGEASEPYLPAAPTNPLNVYGSTKRDGERVGLTLCATRCLIVRTAWVYSSVGNNFVRTMLRLLAERDAVDVVTEQSGTPTWARSLAEALWRFAARQDLNGIYHWTDGGVSTWHGFASAIQEEALAQGLLTRSAKLRGVPDHYYPTAARRPKFGVLDTRASIDALGYAPRPWRENLREMLHGMAAA